MTEADVICPACDFVLDTSFLGDDITDDKAGERLPAPPVANEDHSMFGDDAVILGRGTDEYASFDAEDTGFVQREVTNARIYIGGQTQALLAPDAIPGRAPDADVEATRLSPYEQHVLQFVNGRRPVGRIRKKSGMEDPELKLALAMMADKGVIHMVGVVDEERKRRARERRRQKLKEQREGKERKRREGTKGKRRKSRSRRSAEEESPGRGASPAESTRVEAIPASLREELAKSADEAREPAAVPGHAPSPPSEEESRRRRRPPLPPSLRKGAPVDGELSEVSSLAEAAEPGAHTAERRGVMSAVEPTSVGRAPLADELGDDESEADEGAWAAPSARDQPPEADAPDDEEEFEGGAPTAEISAPEGAPLPAASPSTEASPDDDEPPDDAPEAFELDDPTEAIDPAAEAVSLSMSFDLSDEIDQGPSLPPPLPSDHSMLEAEPEDDEGREVHDLPTGPVTPAMAESVDDSLLPTGEGAAEDAEAVSLELSLEEPDDVPVPEPPTGPGAPARPLTLPSDALEPLPAAPATPLPGAGVPPPEAPRLSIEEDEDDEADGEDGAGAGELPFAEAQALLDEDDSDEEESAEGPALEDDSDEESDEGAPVEVSFENRRKAEKIFEQAEGDAAQGNFSSARMNAKLAMIYDPANKRYRQAVEEWGAAADNGPPRPPGARPDVILFQKAREAEQRGQYEKACYHLKKALDINPKAAPVYNLLGVIQATRLKKYEEAAENLMQACDLNPGNLSFKNNLGKVLGMAESVRDKRVVRDDDDDMVKVKKIRPKFF